jgi:hypothetical protein
LQCWQSLEAGYSKKLNIAANIPMWTKYWRSIQCFLTTLELSSNSAWLLVGSWLFCTQHLPCSVSFRCRLGGTSGEVWRTIYIDSLKIELILACQEVLKWVWLSDDWNGLPVFHILGNTTSKHAPKVGRYYEFCTQNNQRETKEDPLPTKKLHWAQK